MNRYCEIDIGWFDNKFSGLLWIGIPENEKYWKYKRHLYFNKHGLITRHRRAGRHRSKNVFTTKDKP